MGGRYPRDPVSGAYRDVELWVPSGGSVAGSLVVERLGVRYLLTHTP
jgi:hypothetical protein